MFNDRNFREDVDKRETAYTRKEKYYMFLYLKAELLRLLIVLATTCKLFS